MRLTRGERTRPTLSPSWLSTGSRSNAVAILAQHRVITQWQPFKDLKQTFAVSCRAQQLLLHTQQDVVATVEDSVLRVEMGALESQGNRMSQRGFCGTNQWVF